MKTFDYYVAENLDAAVAECSENKPVLKAGGIDLIDLMKERIAQPESVLSIGSIKDLSYIREENGGVRIGCLTTLAEIGRNEMLAKKFAGFHTAAAHAATPQIRERATLGGNLCQRPRCWYFRNIEFHCLKKGGSSCYAPEGENQYHAILGGGPCHIVHPSNTAPALVALDARFVIQGHSGRREVKAEEFFVLPSKAISRENVLEDGEILTEVIIPAAPQASATVELREKQSFDWPMAIASVVKASSGTWRICLGAVAPVPWLATKAMQTLANADVTDETATRAAEAALADAKPLSMNSYKVQLAKVAVRRALLKASGQDVPA